LIANANSADQLLVGRAVTGLAAGTWVPLVAVFSSQFPAHEVVRATALLTFVSSLGRVSATGLNGSLNNWGGYSLAFFAAVGVAALAVLLVLPAHEQRRPRYGHRWEQRATWLRAAMCSYRPSWRR